MAKSDEFIEALPKLAWTYIEECIENKKEFVTVKGETVKIADRHIPTISYFLQIWLPLNHGDTFHRDTWYEWINQKDDKDKPTPKSDTIKSIDEVFKALAEDIVANEGKGIFYAKNRLGMTDKNQIDQTANVKVLTVDPLSDDSKE